MDEGVRTLDRRSHNPELYQLSYVHHIITSNFIALNLALTWTAYRPADGLMARPAGFEPATHGLEGRCSIQLSYGRLTFHPLEYPEWKWSG